MQARGGLNRAPRWGRVRGTGGVTLPHKLNSKDKGDALASAPPCRGLNQQLGILGLKPVRQCDGRLRQRLVNHGLGGLNKSPFWHYHLIPPKRHLQTDLMCPFYKG